MKIKDDKGQEIEVFTAAELEQKTKEASTQAAQKAIEDYKAQNPDKSGEVEKLKADLASKEEALKAAEASGNQGQIERLRKERDEAKSLAEKATSDFNTKFEAFKKEVIGDVEKDLLTQYSKGNKELSDKIKFEFDNYRPGATSKKDIQDRMAVAYKLVTGKQAPSVFDHIGGGAGDRGNFGGGGGDQKKEWKPNEIAIGNVLGVSDKDREAYIKFKGDQDKKKGL